MKTIPVKWLLYALLAGASLAALIWLDMWLSVDSAERAAPPASAAP
jgi:hypothetical protein